MPKRILSIFLAAFLLLSLFSGCTKQEEYGRIEDTEVTEIEEPASDAPSMFDRQTEPFDDYIYKTVDFECAGLSFEVPENWISRIYNQSCIRYDAPDDDPHFPGITFYFKCNYDFDASENDLDPFSSYATEFGKPMSSYITGLPYLVYGRDTWIRSYSVADYVETPSFCSEENAACIKVTKDITLINKVTADTVLFEGADFVTGYFRWENFPAMISCVIPSALTQDAKSMISYMMSSVRPAERTIAPLWDFEYRGVSFSIPSDFEDTADSPFILISPGEDIKATSGMTIGVFRMKEDLSAITEEYFRNTYQNTLAGTLIDPSCAGSYTVGATLFETDNRLLDEKKSFTGNVDIIANDEDYISAKMEYGVVSVWMLDSFITERKDGLYLIAAMYPRHEAELAKSIEKTILQTFSAK